MNTSGWLRIPLALLRLVALATSAAITSCPTALHWRQLGAITRTATMNVYLVRLFLARRLLPRPGRARTIVQDFLRDLLDDRAMRWMGR